MKSCRGTRRSAVRLKKRCQFSKLRSGRSMSALGKQTFPVHKLMSALPPKADMVRVTRLREPQPIIALNRRPRRTRPSLDGRRDRIPIQTLDKSFGIMQISRLKALCESAVNRAQ
jgi:hypothetical protein